MSFLTSLDLAIRVADKQKARIFAFVRDDDDLSTQLHAILPEAIKRLSLSPLVPLCVHVGSNDYDRVNECFNNSQLNVPGIAILNVVGNKISKYGGFQIRSEDMGGDIADVINRRLQSDETEPNLPATTSTPSPAQPTLTPSNTRSIFNATTQSQNLDDELALKIAAAKKKLAEKQKAEEEKKKAEEKEKELERIKQGKLMQEAQERKQEQEIREAAAERRRQKIEDEAAKKRILEQIKADRAERFGGQVATPSKETPIENKPAPIQKDVVLVKIRHTAGQFTEEFKNEETLQCVVDAISKQNLDIKNHNLFEQYPRRQFTAADYDKTFVELGLTPSCTLVLEPLRRENQVSRAGSGIFDLIWVLIMAPLNFLRALFIGRAGGNVEANPNPTRNTMPDRQQRNNATSAAVRRRLIAGLQNDNDGENKDDDMANYNGNSTQFL